VNLTYQEEKGRLPVEKLQFTVLEGRRLKLGDNHPHTLKSWNNLIDLYEAWDKPEKAEEWQAKLARRNDAEKPD